MESLVWLAKLGLVVFVIENLVFYGVCIFLVVYGLRRIVKGTLGNVVIGVLLIALAALPFVHYESLRRQGDREIARVVADLASVERHPVSPAERPDTIVIRGNSWLARSLVGAGIFHVAYDEFNRHEWFKYTVRADDGCPVPFDAAPAKPTRYWNAARECVDATKTEGPPETGPYISFLFGRYAPSRRLTSYKSVMAGSLMELRWSPDKGGGLIDFWQRPYFKVLSFPPRIAGLQFLRHTYTPNPDRSHDPNQLDFLLKAVGLPPALGQAG